MNITAHVVRPQHVVLKKDTYIYQDPFGMIGRMIKAGTEMIALCGSTRINVSMGGFAGYILG